MNNDSAAWTDLAAFGKSHLLELQFVDISVGSTGDGVRQPSEALGSKAESAGDNRGAQVLKQEVAGPGVLAGSGTLAAIPVDRRVEGLVNVLSRRGKAGVSLVIQCLRIHSAMQGTPV